MSQRKNANRNEVRIIGGKWRGRKLRFAPHPDLRPTPGRTRETLFNWLRGELEGRACVDLFAGSGALGFEALSQGAASVVFIDRSRACCSAIKANIELLQAQSQARVVTADAVKYLAQQGLGDSVVFCDPPFRAPELVPSVLNTLNSVLNGSECWVYAEGANLASLQQAAQAHHWTVAKITRAGDSHAVLLHSSG